MTCTHIFPLIVLLSWSLLGYLPASTNTDPVFLHWNESHKNFTYVIIFKIYTLRMHITTHFVLLFSVSSSVPGLFPYQDDSKFQVTLTIYRFSGLSCPYVISCHSADKHKHT